MKYIYDRELLAALSSLHGRYIGIMENKMETTVVYWEISLQDW